MSDTSPERVAEVVDDLQRHYGTSFHAGDLIEALAAERDALRDEVRRFQGWVDLLDALAARPNGGLFCEDMCPVVCAGPCEGRPIGAALNETGDATP